MESKIYSDQGILAPFLTGDVSLEFPTTKEAKTKVVVVERVFPHYRKPVFDALSREVDLRVLHGANSSGIQSACAKYAEAIPSLQYGPGETQVLLFPLRRIRELQPQVVLFDFALGMLNLPWILNACQRQGMYTAFWSHGYNRKTGFHPEKSALDQYRLNQLRRADALILYSQQDRKVLEEYLSPERLFVAPNTLNTPALLQIRNELDQEGRAAIKKRRNIRHTRNIGFIGRLLPAKKPELLLSLYEHLRTQYGVRVGVHFIGDGEMLPLIREQVRKKKLEADVYFYGPVHDDRLSGELLYCFDLMVMPGDLGLSVNHAFCFDCPVASYQQGINGPFHGPEVEYVVDGETGFLVKVQTPKAMAEAVFQYLMDVQMERRFKENIRYAAEHRFPLEKMVGGVMEGIQYMTKHVSHFV